MIYVDKTEYISQLVDTHRFVLLSRPRRFGKSLILSTLRTFFEGKRELFEGLTIAERETDWKIYPVIKIDFSETRYEELGYFDKTLVMALKRVSREMKVSPPDGSPSTIFAHLIQELSDRHGKVVVLVDEYDKPLVNIMHNPEVFTHNRTVLAGLYSVLKQLDSRIRFAMLTGISRFAQAGVFSGLNNLYDISLDQSFRGIVGFTQTDLEHYFSDRILKLEQKFEVSSEVMRTELRQRYNGYSWGGDETYYNPFSILSVFTSTELEDYWFRTATPSFLYEYLKRENVAPQELVRPVTSDLVGYSRPDGWVPLLPLLFQTGYLTIDRIVRQGFQRLFHLRFPNQEVARAFSTLTIAAYQDHKISEIDDAGTRLRTALYEGNLDHFYKILATFFADIPSRLHVNREAYYHSMVYFLFRVLDMKMDLEQEKDYGRLDAVLELLERVYVFEFKFSTAKSMTATRLSKQALDQIKKHDYAKSYRDGNREVVLVGLGFAHKKLHGRHEVG